MHEIGVDSDVHMIADEMMSRQAHGCPGPPGLQTGRPLSGVPESSCQQTYLQTGPHVTGVSKHSDPPCMQTGLSSSTGPQCSVPPSDQTWRTLSSLQEYLVPYSDPPCLQTSREHQQWVPPYRKTGLLLSGVQEHSVPEQDQLLSLNDYNQQLKVRGVQPEFDDDDVLSKTTKEEDDTVTSKSAKDECEKVEKHVRFSEDVKTGNSGNSFREVQNFIKEYVKKELKSKKPDIKSLCDAVIVYDKNDYDHAVEMRDEIKAVVLNALGEYLRIKLFDDEDFMQSHVQVVQDVLKNASVVLVYLSKNTENSRQVQFFVEEAVALTRIGTIDQEALDSECEFSVRPVHSQPSNRRRYRTPTGLASVSGIDWYDKSSYTYNKIVAIMKNAIRRRKRIENPRQVQHEFKHAMLRTTPLTPHQYHPRDAPQHNWAAGTSAYTTLETRQMPKATSEPWQRGSEHTQYGLNVSTAESMMRNMSVEPNVGSAGSSYTQGGNDNYRTGGGHTSANGHVYQNMNTSIVPPGEPAFRQDVSRHTRPLRLEHGHQHAEYADFRGYPGTSQFSMTDNQDHLRMLNQLPQNEKSRYRHEDADGLQAVGLANYGQGMNTSRTTVHADELYGGRNQSSPTQPAMQWETGVQRHNPVEYSRKTQPQQQQQQILQQDRMAMGSGILTYEMLASNLSTNDVEIDNPPSIQTSRPTNDQVAYNAHSDVSDSSDNDVFGPLAKEGGVVNIVGSKVLQIGNQNSVNNIRNIVKKAKKARAKEYKSIDDVPKKHISELQNNTDNENKPDIKSEDLKHTGIAESLSQKLGYKRSQSNIAKSNNDLGDSSSPVCKMNVALKTDNQCGKMSQVGIRGCELNIPLDESRGAGNTDAKWDDDVSNLSNKSDFTQLTAELSSSDIRQTSQKPMSHEMPHEKITEEGRFMTTDGGLSVLSSNSSPNIIEHAQLRSFTNITNVPKQIDAKLSSLDENTESRESSDYASTDLYEKEICARTYDDISDADLFGDGKQSRQPAGRTLFASRSSTAFSDLVNRSLVSEDDSCEPVDITEVD